MCMMNSTQKNTIVNNTDHVATWERARLHNSLPELHARVCVCKREREREREREGDILRWNTSRLLQKSRITSFTDFSQIPNPSTYPFCVLFPCFRSFLFLFWLLFFLFFFFFHFHFFFFFFHFFILT